MAKPEKTLPPVRPSAAAAARYDAKLQVLIKAMAESVLYWLSATYKANPPVMTEMAGDELPATELKRAVRELSKRWQRRFDEAAPALAEYYTKAAHLRSKTELKRILRNAGISVEFKMTRAMRDVMHASVAEQVSLIKSIPQKYFTDVEGAVMRAATAGRDLHALTKEIGNKVDLSRIKMGRKPGESDKSLAARTARRAAFIARDQVSKMQASFNRVRLVEIGVTECVWQHSGLDRDPRESHRAASKRQQKFDVAKGWLDPEVGRLIQPGELPNCFPGDTQIFSGDIPVCLWRTPFNGPMVHLQVGATLLKGTPNHPVLTRRGWLRLDKIERGDEIVCVSQNDRDVVGDHKNDFVATFDELFATCAVRFGNMRRQGADLNFHGHVPQGHVDEVVVRNNLLGLYRKFGVCEDLQNLLLPEADAVERLSVVGGIDHVSPPDPAGFLSIGLLLDRRLARSAHDTCSGTASHNAGLHQDDPDIRGCVPGGVEMFCNGGGSEALLVKRNDRGRERRPIHSPIGLDTDFPQAPADIVGIAANSAGRVFEFGSRLYEFRRAGEKHIRDFSGHVFTMETIRGHYSVGGAFALAKNCKCFAKPVIPGF